MHAAEEKSYYGLGLVWPVLAHWALAQGILSMSVALTTDTTLRLLSDNEAMRQRLANADTTDAVTIKTAFGAWNKVTNPITKQLEPNKGLTLRLAREAALYLS